MRVVVVGATGNVGTSLLEALREEPNVDSVLGIARRLPELALPRSSGHVPTSRATTSCLHALRSVHSGVVGDYVAWLTFGVAALGGLLALVLR